jgi:SET family sugar efflux transporter-like MFS transporter
MVALDAVLRRRHIGRALLPLGLVCLAVGVSMAVVVPFNALFLSTAVQAGPVRVTVFLIVGPLAGVVASSVIGRLSDRRAMRRLLLIGASVAGLIGTGLTTFVRNYWILLGLTVTATALAGTLFPQTFAYARQALAGDGSGRSALIISTLRTVFSLAWVAGPPLGAFLLATGGFAYVYSVAAVMYAVAGLVATFWLEEVNAPAAPATAARAEPVPGALDAREPPRWTLLRTAAAFTILQTPLTLGVQALPLFISTDLGGHVADAGFVLGLCAALKIPLMLGLGALTSRVPLRALVLAGGGCGVAYYALATATRGVWLLAAAQILNAAFIAAVSGLGISYMQDMLPQHPGRATTLFTNSFPIGAMLAGPLFGVAQHFDFRVAYGIGTAVCATGLLTLFMTQPRSPSTLLPGPQQQDPLSMNRQPAEKSPTSGSRYSAV